MKTRLYFIIFSSALFLTCAFRDNIFDPKSPFYKPDPPLLSIVFNFDSTKITDNKNDTLYANTPFNFTFAATSKGGFDRSIDLEVQYTYYLNGISKKTGILEDSIQITLYDSGVHIFQFESSENDTTVIERKVIYLSHKSAPVIFSFRCNEYNLFTKRSNPVFFFSEILDSNSLLEKIVYNIPNQNSIIRPVQKYSSKIVDTLPYTFLTNDTGTQKVTLKITDIFKRSDSAEIILHFISPKDPIDPPNIRRITYSPEKIRPNQDVEFDVSYTSSVENLKTYWSFGDTNERTWEEDSIHQFNKPGSYWVAVKVGNDSVPYSIDSEKVEIYPSSNIPPKITSLFISPNTGKAPLKTAMSVIANDSDGVILTYKWEFLSLSNDKSETIYESFGSSYFFFTFWYPSKYLVKVTVIDDYYGSDSYSDTVIVTGEQKNEPILVAYPSPAFTFTPIDFRLENIPDNYNATKFTWCFPFDTVDTNVPFNKLTIPFMGDYNVKVIVNDDNNRSFSVPVKILLYYGHY